MKETLILVGGIFIAIIISSLVVTGLVILTRHNANKRYCKELANEILKLNRHKKSDSLCLHKYKELVEKSAKLGIFMEDIDVYGDELAKIALEVHRRYINNLVNLSKENQVRGSRDQVLESEIVRMVIEGNKFEKDFITSPKPPTHEGT